LKFTGSGYDSEYDIETTPFEDRLSSTKAMFVYEGPALLIITYILSLILDFKFSFWVWFVVGFCILQLMFEWFMYFKKNVFTKFGVDIHG
tara:strand:- start:384 stop:653 length:270 start_codon:yes stop_codon:yes gene_type:complete